MQSSSETPQLLDPRFQTQHPSASPRTPASTARAVHARKATVLRNIASAFKLAFIVQIIVNARNGKGYVARIHITLILGITPQPVSPLLSSVLFPQALPLPTPTQTPPADTSRSHTVHIFGRSYRWFDASVKMIARKIHRLMSQKVGRRIHWSIMKASSFHN